MLLHSFTQIFALLAGMAFLLTGSGLQGLLMPLRGGSEGFSLNALGLLGAAWAGGFMIGCLLAPRLVRRVGHIRAFCFFASSAAIIALLTGLFINSTVWIVLRSFTGFSMAGAYMVIESWLNESATNKTRGKIFGLYMMVNYGAVVSGQMLIPFADVHTPDLFILTGIFFCLALIPTSISIGNSPKPLSEARLDLKAFYRNSPLAFVSCILIGIANGAWGTLGAVYGADSGIDSTTIAFMLSLAMLAGAFTQLPVGRLSDQMDRRLVLASVAGAASLVGFLIFLVAPSNTIIIFILIALYGGLAYALYPIAVAHANDFAASQDFIKISGGLLLLYGFGTMIGPLLAATAMDHLHPTGLFAITALAHLLVSGYALVRIRWRATLSASQKDVFQTLPPERTVTPEALKLYPRDSYTKEKQN